ncbi:phosphoenolpyruvate carboxylase [Leptotrichia sp. OH3620_COT-345]|nr:phosphoenolpyruvate carboxylase [Leptotrichia sp. OH3620_COT-345]
MVEEISNLSRKVYKNLIYNTERFTGFFFEVTLINTIIGVNIGF